MLIVFFLIALVGGGLTVWLLWPMGVAVALVAAAVVASVVVAIGAVMVASARSRAPAGDAARPRGLLDMPEPRRPR